MHICQVSENKRLVPRQPTQHLQAVTALPAGPDHAETGESLAQNEHPGDAAVHDERGDWYQHLVSGIGRRL